MTRFASRSSGFVLFAPRDSPTLSSFRPWRDEYIRSRAELPRCGAKGRTTPCLRACARARARTCHRVYVRVYVLFVFTYAYVRVRARSVQYARMRELRVCTAGCCDSE